jgi:ubiquinone/menaquinone biosynthesis C-methylase UbiE
VHEETRRSYDALAEEYDARLADELSYKPLDRALLSVLLEERATGLPVADLGCGPGHVTAWLAERCERAVGIDLSPQMIELARRRYRNAEFRVGDLLSLPAADSEFGAAIAFYSIIHLGPDEIQGCVTELLRVLAPSGPLLLAFHLGHEVRHFDELWGTAVDLDFRFLDTDDMAGLLAGEGFEVEARLERGSYPQEVETRRAYVLARRPG